MIPSPRFAKCAWLGKGYDLIYRIGFVAAALVLAGPAIGQQLYAYPKSGQSPDQQSRDRYECHMWAVQQSGYDPTTGTGQPATAQTQQQPQQTAGGQQGKPGGGAAGGAAKGATRAAIMDNDVGKGAAMGAAGGMLRRRMQEKKEDAAQQKQQQMKMQQQQQMAQQQQAVQQQQGQKADGYRRAFSACMEARNYTVK